MSRGSSARDVRPWRYAVPDEGPVSPAVVGFLEDYIAEVDMADALEQTEMDADELLVVFCREAFNQFFSNVLLRPMQAPSSLAAEMANLLAREHPEWSPQRRRVVRQYQHFCKMYWDLVGEFYGGGTDTVRRFHFEFVPAMLDDLVLWAAQAREAELVARLIPAQLAYARLLKG